MKNAINWFEIPVINMERAEKFYSTVFDTKLIKTDFGSTQMRMFPNEGVTGCLVQGADFEPSATGLLIYFACGDDLAPVLNRVADAGGKVILPKSIVSKEIGYHAMFVDTEGNRIGLHSIN